MIYTILNGLMKAKKIPSSPNLL